MTIDITATIVVGLAALAISFINLLYTRFGVELRMTERLKEIEVKVALFMKVFEAHLPTLGILVKAPTHERMDTLIDKFVNKACSIAEMYELRDWLNVYRMELEQDFLKKKQASIEGGTTLPEAGKILATTLLLATVGLQLIQHEQIAKAPQKTWRRWLPIFSWE